MNQYVMWSEKSLLKATRKRRGSRQVGSSNDYNDRKTNDKRNESTFDREV